jgi:hypothetical protein
VAHLAGRRSRGGDSAVLSSSLYHNEADAMGFIVSWWRTGEYQAPSLARFSRFEDPDYRAVAEAIQVLERAGLLMRDLDMLRGLVGLHAYFVSFYVGLTRLGWQAVQTNTVRQHLGLDAPSTA